MSAITRTMWRVWCATSLQPRSTAAITRESGVKRTTVHMTLQRFIAAGLVDCHEEVSPRLYVRYPTIDPDWASNLSIAHELYSQETQ